VIPKCALAFLFFDNIMRRLFILLSVLSLSLLSMEAADYRLFLEDFSIDAGETKDISLYLDNVGDITGIQADIVLPEGLTIAVDDEGYYCVTLNSSRKTRNHTIDGNYQADGTFRIISYTSDSKAFKLNTGEIATITITASSEFKGTHTIEVRHVELAAPDGTQFFPDDESCIVTGPAGEVTGGYRVYLENIEITAGQTTIVGLIMENPDEITGIQTDLYLPDGLSVAIDDEDYYCIELNPERKTRNHTIDGNYQEDGSFRIISYTSDSKPFNYNNGAVAFITLKADDNFEGTHLIQIMNTELANPSGTQFWPTDETSTVTCTAGVHTLRGDVNGDGSVNISDVTALIDYLLSGNANGISLVGADCNTDGSINISDVTALIDYLLSGSWP